MMDRTFDQALHLALGHHQAGRLEEAERIYRQVLAQAPGHAAALNLLGMLAGQTGRTALALDLLARAVAAGPGIAEYHSNLGEIHRRAGLRDDAIACFRRALALNPGLTGVHTNLGHALREAGQLDAAIASYECAVEPGSADADAWNNLGVALHEAGRSEAALAAFEQATARVPGHAEAQNNRGVALRNLGRLDEAVLAHLNALALEPGDVRAHSNLGVALAELGRFEEAIAAYHRALALRPDLAEAHTNLGNALRETGQLDGALAAHEHAIALGPQDAEAHNNLGSLLRDQGRLDLALAAFGKAALLKPGFAQAASNRLLTLYSHPDQDAASILAAHRAWAARYAAPLAAEVRPHRNDRNPERRLKVGYVSADLCDHPVGRMLLAVFRNHDRAQFDVVAYSDARVPDAVTAELQRHAGRWRATAGLGDVALAEIIRDDAIDVLVDLALHTAGNRMLVFARKPAPVQVTMLGLPATTGLDTIDYRLTDRYLDPPGETDADYTEPSVRLPHCYWIFVPPDPAPAVGALPALKNGIITIGCLNQLAKVTAPALRLWARILAVVPGARLVLQSHAGRHLEPLCELFAQEGIARNRVAFVPPVARPAYLERLATLDLGLDPFPYNGHTSTLDTLWMGVPVVTLAGRTAVGRGGVSILSNLGLDALIAQTPEEYLDIAVSLARAPERLAALRAEMRPRMLGSALVDAKKYTADVERALRRMWQAWCQRGA
jgi:predicted O-linked N-acetylglucosamine transferase (SPINDLY family)